MLCVRADGPPSRTAQVSINASSSAESARLQKSEDDMNAESKDELVATCSAEQAAVVAADSGRIAIVNGEKGTITYNDAFDLSGAVRRTVTIDFRNPSGTPCSA